MKQDISSLLEERFEEKDRWLMIVLEKSDYSTYRPAGYDREHYWFDYMVETRFDVKQHLNLREGEQLK